MSAPTFKLTMLFASGDDQFSWGWSETWYTDETLFSVVQGVAPDICQYRSRILTADANIRAYRISQILPPVVAPFKRNQRSSFLVEQPYPGLYGATNSEDLPWTGVLVRFQGTDNHTQKWVTFHGVPDAFFLANKGAIPGDWKGFLNGYTRVLRNSNFGIRHSLRTVPKTYNVVPAAQATAERNASRKVGRPFGLLRGRRFAHQA